MVLIVDAEETPTIANQVAKWLYTNGYSPTDRMGCPIVVYSHSNHTELGIVSTTPAKRKPRKGFLDRLLAHIDIGTTRFLGLLVFRTQNEWSFYIEDPGLRPVVDGMLTALGNSFSVDKIVVHRQNRRI